MQLSEIRISLCPPHGGRLKAFCSLTFDNTFVIRDVKLIDGNDGLFLAMPARKLCDRCRRCGEKNHLRAKFCNNCGQHLDENRAIRASGNGARVKLHADIAHPINAECRRDIEQRALAAYREEVERSKQPGYQPLRIDLDYDDLHDDHAPAPKLRGFDAIPQIVDAKQVARP
ncbi:MAG TPA: SpoVG family protein [Tepidisphaeraceae bacterium]|nr:SpoVG family protein [Tepidisphaeraceae bacterium]